MTQISAEGEAPGAPVLSPQLSEFSGRIIRNLWFVVENFLCFLSILDLRSIAKHGLRFPLSELCESQFPNNENCPIHLLLFSNFAGGCHGGGIAS